GTRRRAQSPTPPPPGGSVRPAAAVRPPRSSSSPESASQPVAGRTPIPTSTRSAGTRSPPTSCTPSPSTEDTLVPVRSSAPAAAYQAAVCRPTASPGDIASGAGPASSTVPAHPAVGAAGVPAAPIQLAPTSTTRAPGRRPARSRRASSRVRRVTPVPGSSSGSDPQASTRPSNPTGPAVVCSSPGRSAVARTPSRRSTPAYHSGSSSSGSPPASTALDSGGPSYRGSRSPPPTTTS